MKNFVIISVFLVCFLVVTATASSVVDDDFQTRYASVAALLGRKPKLSFAPISAFANRAVANLRHKIEFAPAHSRRFAPAGMFHLSFK